MKHFRFVYLIKKIIVCFFIRWHQVIVGFQLQSVLLRFDSQFDREIELPLSGIRKVNSIHMAFLEMNNQGNGTESFFKVKFEFEMLTKSFDIFGHS